MTDTAHEAIRDLITRFFHALDARRFDDGWAAPYLAPGARTTTPVGTAEGPAAADLAREALERFAATQHFASDHLIEVDAAGERAAASWNALMVHVHHDGSGVFTVGGRWHADLVRTGHGWRFTHLTVAPRWTTGTPPVLPEGLPAPVAS
jgi:hypothetical protein